MTKIFFLVVSVLLSTSASADNWSDKVKLDGDFRLREHYEKDDDNAANYKMRVRARLNVSADVSEEVKAYLGFSTGSLGSSNTSANQDLGGEFENKNFALSKAFFVWTPYTAAQVMGGKMLNPLFRAGGSQLIWDEDVNPEGVAATWNCQCSDTATHFFNLAHFVMDVRYTTTSNPDINNPDPTVNVAQVGGKYSLSNMKLNWAAAYTNFASVKDATVVDAAKGNSTTGGKYDNLYEVANLGFEMQWPEMSWPVTFYADWIQNMAIEEDNQGYLVGVKAGQNKARGDMEVGYNYRQIDSDATLSFLNDSDFSNGNDDTNGHLAWIKYSLNDKSMVSLSYYASEIGISGTNATDYSRAHLDYSLKF